MPIATRRKFRRKRIFKRSRRLRPKVRALSKRVNTISRMIKGESNYFDVRQTPFSVSTTASIINLCPVLEGTGPQEYQGNSIMGLSLLVRMSIVGADTTDGVRIVIFRDKNATGGVPIGVGGILQDTGNYLSPLANSERGRWQILYDKVFVTTQGGIDRQIEKYFKVFKKPKLITFSSDANAPQRGTIYLLAISDSAAVSHPTLEFYSRLRYYDT